MKNFSCFKNKKKSDKEPDYRLTAKDGENFVEIGAGWIKEKQNGDKYISFKLSDAYKDIRKGWYLKSDEDSNDQSEIDYQNV